MNNQQEHAQALLALNATRGTLPLQGEAPTHEELALMLDNKIDFKRRQEIYSHLNSNITLFNEWMALVELQQSQQSVENITQQASLFTRATQQLQIWLTPKAMGYSAAGLAAVMVLAIFINTPQHNTESIASNSAQNDSAIVVAPHKPEQIEKTAAIETYDQTKNVDVMTRGIKIGLLSAFAEEPAADQQRFALLLDLQKTEKITTDDVKVDDIETGKHLFAAYKSCVNNQTPNLTETDITKLKEIQAINKTTSEECEAISLAIKNVINK